MGDASSWELLTAEEKQLPAAFRPQQLSQEPSEQLGAVPQLGRRSKSSSRGRYFNPPNVPARGVFQSSGTLGNFSYWPSSRGNQPSVGRISEPSYQMLSFTGPPQPLKADTVLTLAC